MMTQQRPSPPEPANCAGCIPSGCRPRKCDTCDGCETIALSIDDHPLAYILICLALIMILRNAIKMNGK